MPATTIANPARTRRIIILPPYQEEASKLAKIIGNARSRGLYARVQIPPEEFFD
jgi:hypothetical protein